MVHEAQDSLNGPHWWPVWVVHRTEDRILRWNGTWRTLTSLDSPRPSAGPLVLVTTSYLFTARGFVTEDAVQVRNALANKWLLRQEWFSALSNFPPLWLHRLLAVSLSECSRQRRAISLDSSTNSARHTQSTSVIKSLTSFKPCVIIPDVSQDSVHSVSVSAVTVLQPKSTEAVRQGRWKKKKKRTIHQHLKMFTCTN